VGMPGALPVLNEAAVDLASRAAFVLNSEPQKFSRFDRKHYFYPDLPKGYQITQYEQPIIVGGHVNVEVNGETKMVRIVRVNLEEDAGKNIHPEGADYSLVDLNRAGTPLMEIVSEPDLHNAQEAKAYARELYLLMKYADVTIGDLYHGNVRFDVNISVSSDPDQLGTRTEIKNLNSFKSVEATVEYEIKRQIHELKNGRQIIQETRGWDEVRQKTTAQRRKEEAHDYRYMPEPDIPPIELSDEYIKYISNKMPRLTHQWRKLLRNIDIHKGQIEQILEAEIEFDNLSVLTEIEKNSNEPGKAKFIANWFINSVLPLSRSGKLLLNQDDTIKLIEVIYSLSQNGQLSSSNSKLLFEELAGSESLPTEIEQYAKSKNLIQVSDESEVQSIVSQIIKDNPKAVDDIKSGQEKAIKFLVGQVMAKSRGQANPALAENLIKKALQIS
jgi:aspartyl-tRNA(Asn)/glutamyl-tRNA(Gln) amidotransferase subunit B